MSFAETTPVNASTDLITPSRTRCSAICVTPSPRQGERLQAVLERASEASGIELKDFEAVTTNAEEASKILPAEANGNFEGWRCR